MVAVDVDDQDVVEAALDRLLAGVGEEPAGVELFERHPPTAIGKKVHGVLLRLQYRTLLGAATMAAPPVWPSASQTGGSVHQPPQSRNITRMCSDAPSILLLVERMAAVAVGTQLGDVFLELFLVARPAGVVGAFRGLRRALVEIGKTGPDLGSGEVSVPGSLSTFGFHSLLVGGNRCGNASIITETWSACEAPCWTSILPDSMMPSSSSMLSPIEPIRILRAKITSLGVAAL